MIIPIQIQKRLHGQTATVIITVNGRTVESEVNATKINTGAKLRDWLKANRQEIVRLAKETIVVHNLELDTVTEEITLVS